MTIRTRGAIARSVTRAYVGKETEKKGDDGKET